jgi:nucleoside-diphosphate-sugar epimerase
MERGNGAFMKALVTGGGGFIGSHVVQRLVEADHAVRVLDNFSTGRRSNLDEVADGAEIVEGDICSYERVHHAVGGCDVVVHLAALPSVPRSTQDPLTSHATNATGTLNVLLCARDAGVRRVILASSSSVYGLNRALPKREDMAPAPLSPYAVAKLTSEGYCRSFTEVYGLETVALRYFNVFGPRQDPRSEYAAAIPRFVSALRSGDPPTVFGDGEQSRDFTYVGDAADATVLAIEAPEVSGRVLNVARGKRVTVNQLLSELGRLLDVDVRPVHVPARPGEVRHSLADCSLAREVLGYRPKVSLSEGLGLTVEHFRGEGRDAIGALSV